MRVSQTSIFRADKSSRRTPSRPYRPMPAAGIPYRNRASAAVSISVPSFLMDSMSTTLGYPSQIH
jgi:hypothetical protein